MNLNQLAKDIATMEGKKQSLSIAQIKEVLKCLGTLLWEMQYDEMFDTLKRLVK